jgi:predicted membrane protein
MKKLFGAFITLIAVSVAMWLVGQRMAKKFQGDTTPDDDSFRLMAFMGGTAVKSHATALRSAQIKVRAGGLDLDLTEATLSAEGAHVELDVAAGGVQVTVPADWRVYVVEHVDKGEVDIDVPDPETLPKDAPILTIQVEVKAGGVAIRSETRPLIPV